MPIQLGKTVEQTLWFKVKVEFSCVEGDDHRLGTQVRLCQGPAQAKVVAMQLQGKREKIRSGT